MDYCIKPYGRLSEDLKNARFPMHMHDTYEIYSIYAGDADYYVEGTRYSLQHGDIVVMRKSESHQIVLRSDAPYGRRGLNFEIPFLNEIDPDGKLLSIFEDRPLGQFNHYSAAMFPENNWQYYLKRIYDTENQACRLAYLLPLLSELSECFDVLKSSEQPQRPDPINMIVRYINQNIRKDLSLSVLCEHFYLSKAHLNRIFKLATGTTVWNYIMTKRLMLAREMLMNGVSPTETFVKCGFQDYTTFYRAYRKHFGVSPKQDQI